MRVLLRLVSGGPVAAGVFLVLGLACSAPAPDADVSRLPAEAAAAPPIDILKAGNRYAGDVGDRYLDEVQPAISRRCAVCHACTNGPCQLNMTSFAALERGVSSTNPYEFGLFEKESTRVSDNLPIAAWRARGFRSVLPDENTPPEESVFYRALDLGWKNEASATPTSGPLSIDTYRALAQAHNDFEYSCPATGAEFSRLERRYPMGGMPWATPYVPEDQSLLEEWALDGAPGPSSAALAAVRAPQRTAMSQMDPKALIAEWEAFLDADDLRTRLAVRYIYEHAYSANIHLAENPGEFYRIVRSRTGAPAPIDAIMTDMPQEDPGVDRVHYRLQKIDRVIEGKTHVPWELGLADLAHFKELFLGGDWNVHALPGYESMNPFEVFEPLPATIRSQFMREHSRMIYAGFARGPICLIQAASYAVDEYFWILFVKPESDPTVVEPTLGMSDYSAFFTKAGNLVSGVPVLGDKYGEPRYRAAFEETLRQMKPEGLGVQDIWTGDGTDPDAWLTVHRHQFSVDVHNTVDRPITGLPTSVWLITYANFERMYYNAVAQYKYWGNLRHQNDSFNWQIYTRTEAEDLYASLFPEQSYRTELRDRYTSFVGKLYNKLFTDYARGRPSASPHLRNEDQLARALMGRMGAVLGPEDRLNNWPNGSLRQEIASDIETTAEFEAGVRTLTNRAAPFAGYLPNAVHVRLGGEDLYTLLAVRGYRGDKMAISEATARTRQDDRMVAIPGFAAYEAHLFVDLAYEDAADFLRQLGAVDSQRDWNAFAARFAIARNSAEFWPFVDWLHEWQGQNMPVRAGLLELRVYDMTERPF